jgi:ribosomal protein S18 acetylase RimI-like enzyme
LIDNHRFAIRQMAPEDAAAVANLTSQLGYPSTEADIKRRYARVQDRVDGQLIVALDINAAVVGWIHVQALPLLEADQLAEIWGLVVADTVRGSGVGRLLVEAAEEWAVKRGLDIMGVRSNTLRLEAHAFYEHLGYKVVKTQKAFRKNLIL